MCVCVWVAARCVNWRRVNLSLLYSNYSLLFLIVKKIYVRSILYITIHEFVFFITYLLQYTCYSSVFTHTHTQHTHTHMDNTSMCYPLSYPSSLINERITLAFKEGFETFKEHSSLFIILLTVVPCPSQTGRGRLGGTGRKGRG